MHLNLQNIHIEAITVFPNLPETGNDLSYQRLKNSRLLFCRKLQGPETKKKKKSLYINKCIKKKLQRFYLLTKYKLNSDQPIDL